ncbi:MAG: hypothetical protein AB8B59_14780 [Maribacter sp.]
MQSLFKSVTKLILLSGLALLTFNCSKEDSSNPILESQKVSSSEVQTILTTDDLSSAADDVITQLFQDGQSGKSSKLEDCYVSEFSDTGFTVTFDNCTENGENISGSLTVSYVEGEESSAFTATYTDLSVGQYTINGTRAFTMDASSGGESASFTIVSNMSITLPDDSVIEEIGTKIFGVNFDSTNFENSAVTIGGNWTVKADGNTYSVNISTPLEITFGCEYAGKGIMELTKNGLKVNVDLGDGTCNDIATVIYPDGTEEDISLKD